MLIGGWVCGVGPRRVSRGGWGEDRVGSAWSRVLVTIPADLQEVVGDGPQVYFGFDVLPAQAQVAAESGEQLREYRFDDRGASFVEFGVAWFGQPVGHE